MTIGNRIHPGTKRRLAGALVLTLAGVTTLAATTTDAGAQIGRRRPGGSGRDENRGDNDARGLRASLNTDRTRYDARDTVEVTLQVTNATNRTVSVDLDDEYEYDVTIRDARSGGTIWQRSRDDRGARRERRTIRWEPNQTRAYRVRWDQRDASGRRVRGGTYRIEGSAASQRAATTEVRLDGDDGDTNNNGGGLGGRIPRPFPAPSTDDGRGEGEWGRNGLRAELRANTTSVRPGDNVSLSYTIRNTSSRTQTLRFSTSQQFDIVVRSSRGGRTIWRASEGRSYMQALSSRTLRAGEEHTFTNSWRVDRDLEGGSYEVLAFLTPQGARNGVGEARTTLRVSSRRN